MSNNDDKQRDFDCILSDGIDELIELRATVARLTTALREMKQFLNGSVGSAARELEATVAAALAPADPEKTS